MRKIYIYLIITLWVFSIDNVWAVPVIQYYRFNSKVYQVEFDDRYVKETDINEMVLQTGYATNASGYTEENKENYLVVSTYLKDNANKLDGIVISCPNSKLKAKFNIGGEYSMNVMKNKNNIIIKYNLATRKFDITIKNIFGNKIYIRKVPNENSRNTSGNNMESYVSSQFLKEQNGVYKYSAYPSEKVRFEFYEKSDDNCNGSLLSEHLYIMDDYDVIKVDNPAVYNSDSSSYKLCQQVKSDNSIMKYENTDIIKETIVNLCYDKEITLDDYNNLYYRIDSSYKHAKANYSSSNNSSVEGDSIGSITSDKMCGSGSGSYKCNQTERRSNSFVLHANSNFVVSCTDTYSSTGDKAKLTVSGGGFSYDVDYNVSRSCKMSFIGRPAVLKPQCTCSVSAVNDNWDTSGDWQGTPEGGPNDDFDKCVRKCDGGTYTQNCINSCYSEVYGDDTKRNSLINEMAFNSNSNPVLKFLDRKIESRYDTVKINGGSSFIYEPNPNDYIGRGQTSHNNAANIYNYKGGCEFKISDKCAANGTQMVITVGPAGCSWTPIPDYNKEVAIIQGDYNDAFSSMSSAIPANEVVTYTIVDSYLKDDNGKYYVHSINSNSSELKVIKNADGGPSGMRGIGSVSIGNQGDSVMLMESQASRSISASLPDSYLGKIYGDVVYRTGNRSFSVKKANNKYVLTNPFANTGNSFNISDYYEGGKKYYTNLYSSNVNVVGNVESGVKLASKNICYNIDVRIDNLAGRYTMSNSCYYGVYNNYINTPTNPDDPDCPGNSGSHDGKCPGNFGDDIGELTYIFRPIELTDVFPDRKARWNWTNSAILKPDKNGKDPYLGYVVNPEETIEHIEGVGHTILNENNQQLDYEIILDRGGIARIKNYNKEMKSYTNFTYNCDTRGINLCKTDFLDFGGYIKNERYTRIKDLSTKNGWEW